MTTTTEPTLRRRSHYVRVSNVGNENPFNEEQIVSTFATTWRGQDVCVEVTARRYRVSGGQMTAWNAFVTGGWYGNEDDKWSATDLTDTARDRLKDSVLPFAYAYAESDEREEAMRTFLRNEFKGKILSLDSEYAANSVARDINRVTELDDDDASALHRAIKLYRDFLYAVEREI